MSLTRAAAWMKTMADIAEKLGMIEALAPALHDSFLPPAEQTTPRKRGRHVVQN